MQRFTADSAIPSSLSDRYSVGPIAVESAGPFGVGRLEGRLDPGADLGRADHHEVPGLHEPDRGGMVGGDQEPAQDLVRDRPRGEVAAIAPLEDRPIDRRPAPRPRRRDRVIAALPWPSPEDGGGVVDQVAVLAGDLGQAVEPAERWQSCGDARAGQRRVRGCRRGTRRRRRSPRRAGRAGPAAGPAPGAAIASSAARRGRARGSLARKWAIGGVDVPAEQGPEVDRVVVVVVLERRVALVAVPLGEAPAVVGQADGQGDRLGVGQERARAGRSRPGARRRCDRPRRRTASRGRRSGRRSGSLRAGGAGPAGRSRRGGWRRGRRGAGGPAGRRRRPGSPRRGGSDSKAEIAEQVP